MEKTLEETLAGEFIGNSKPNAVFKLVKPDLDRVSTIFTSKYNGDEVAGGKVEDAFNDVSKLFIKSLYASAGQPEPNTDSGPTYYGNSIREWSAKVGDQHLGELKAAIKRGDKAQVLALLTRAYEAHTNKAESIISKIQEQPGSVQMPIYQAIAKEVGGDPVRVATNLAAAYGALQQKYATQERFN